jgi:sulfur relay (sulfurtransferase) DsrC/TusE family protein
MTMTKPEFDEDGFLVHPEVRLESLALDMASPGGIDRLDEEHWQVIRYLRDHFLAHGTLPAECTACREISLDSRCMERLYGHDLNAHGGLQVCRIPEKRPGPIWRSDRRRITCKHAPGNESGQP